MLVASHDPLWVKIADFGTSKRLDNTVLRTICGTPGYFAPELLGFLPSKYKTSELEQFTFALDIWSLGCLVHELLTSQTPFRDAPQAPDDESGFTIAGTEVDMALYFKYCQETTTFPTEVLHNSQVDQLGINFVKHLLVVNPHERATVADALQNPWLADTQYISRWYGNLQSECADLGLALDFGSQYDKTLMRRIRTTDIVEYIPPSMTEILTELLQRALAGGHNLITSILLASPIRRAEEDSGLALEALFEWAIETGQASSMELLLLSERDINVPFCDGRVPLEVSVRIGNVNVVRVLLDHDADANTNPSKIGGPRVLQIAVENGHTDIVRLLLDKSADVHVWAGSRSLLLAAVDGSHMEIVKLLLARGADVNAGQNGRTSLQTAAKRGDSELVRLLLDSGGEVNSAPSGESGLTALQGAAWGGHTAIVELLLARKADVNAPPARDGWTALQGAARGGHTDIVRVLLANQAKVNALPSRAGATALQAAVERRDLAIVIMLLKAGADPNAQPSRKGRLALQTAVELGSDRMVQLLLEHHANARAGPSGVKRRTMMEIAIENGYTLIAKQLSDQIADADAKDVVRFGLYADLMVSVIALLENTSPVNTELAKVERGVAPLVWSIPDPGRYLLAYMKGRSFLEIPWVFVVGSYFFDRLSTLRTPHPVSATQLEPTNWSAVMRATMIRSLVSLLLTEGADVLPTPSKFSGWEFYFIEPCIIFWARFMFLHMSSPRSSVTRRASPMAVFLIRLIFINPRGKSFMDTGLMASLAGPVAEFVLGILAPDLAKVSVSPNEFRERALQQIIHLVYRLFQRTMATRRVLRARPKKGTNSVRPE